MHNITIILADDHTLIRNGIKILLENDENVEVIGEAANGQEALDLAAELKPDILISDINMPILNGIEATKKLKDVSPDSKAIILSMHDDEAYITQSVDAGASGYLLKDTTQEEFSKALHSVMSGHKYFSGDISEVLVQHYLNLKNGIAKKETIKEEAYNITKREKQILSLIYDGKTNKEIAEQLEKSIRTVETHRFNIMKKLDVGNVTELLRKIDQEQLLA